jgi:hypothetical protein
MHLLEALVYPIERILCVPRVYWGFTNKKYEYRVEKLLLMTLITCNFVTWFVFQDVKECFVDVLIFAFFNFTWVVYVGTESFRKKWRWRLFPIIWHLLRLRTYNNDRKRGEFIFL